MVGSYTGRAAYFAVTYVLPGGHFGIGADYVVMSVVPLGAREEGVRVHELRTWAPFFEHVVEGRKTFEIRLNDRDYAVGDVLYLREWIPTLVVQALT